MELDSHQFLGILNLIHGAGIIHGNLGLDNLLVSDSGDVAIVDFELARTSYDRHECVKEHQMLSDMLHALGSRDRTEIVEV